MTLPQEDKHSTLVADWSKKNASGISLDQHVLLLEKAIRAMEQRALVTLSNVILVVILDRVLHQGKEKFPLLYEIKLDPKNLVSFELLRTNKNYKSEELIEAYQYLLVDLLRVLGRITADILTVPLHQELLKVTWDSENL
jgi:hypothetical protein